jgi:hypothetical protein
MANAPFKKDGFNVTTDVTGVGIDCKFNVHFQVSATNAVAADTDGIHAAITDTGEEQEIITEITNPVVPRNITATAGGTAADIGAIEIVVEGTNANDEAITETLPAFTVNTAGSVTGSKAFKTVTKITVPAHDGTGATTAIGFGSKLGLPFKLAHNTCEMAFLDNAKESTDPTVAVSTTALESNTITLNSSLAGKVVDAYFLI